MRYIFCLLGKNYQGVRQKWVIYDEVDDLYKWRKLRSLRTIYRFWQIEKIPYGYLIRYARVSSFYWRVTENWKQRFSLDGLGNRKFLPVFLRLF